MTAPNTNIISRLKRDILSLEGMRSPKTGEDVDLGLGFMSASFPLGKFPLGAIHEMISENPEAAASSAGFTAGLISGLMKTGGAVVWIGSSRTVFPPALKMFGIAPDQIIFIELRKEKDILWTMEESLKCAGLAAVIGEIPELSFTSSRRFQLAVEKTSVTGFILRSNPKNQQPNACVSRWKIKPLPSYSEDDLPGVGFARWQVDLLKIRNGKPASWQVQWASDHYQEVLEIRPAVILEPKRKTG